MGNDGREVGSDGNEVRSGDGNGVGNDGDEVRSD